MRKVRFEWDVDENLADSLIASACGKLERQKKEERIIWMVIGFFTFALTIVYCVCAL